MRRLLLVEDEVVVGLSLREDLLDVDLVSDLETDVPSAWDRFQQANYDGAIVDVTLERGSGLDLVRLLRERRPYLPIVLATGADSTALEKQFSADLNLRILSKPFQAGALYDCLQSLGI